MVGEERGSTLANHHAFGNLWREYYVGENNRHPIGLNSWDSEIFCISLLLISGVGSNNAGPSPYAWNSYSNSVCHCFFEYVLDFLTCVRSRTQTVFKVLSVVLGWLIAHLLSAIPVCHSCENGSMSLCMRDFSRLCLICCFPTSGSTLCHFLCVSMWDGVAALRCAEIFVFV